MHLCFLIYKINTDLIIIKNIINLYILNKSLNHLILKGINYKTLCFFIFFDNASYSYILDIFMHSILNFRKQIKSKIPEFHGLENEHPHKHLNEFHMICSTIKS